MKNMLQKGTTMALTKPARPSNLQKAGLALQSNANRGMAAIASAPARTFSRSDRRRRRSPSPSNLSPGRAATRQTHAPRGLRLIQSYEAPEQHEQAELESPSPFAADSTFTLVKKLAIYKLMGSNLFIDYSLMGVGAAYKVFGTRLTNFAIEKTCGSVFTGGVDLQDLSVAEKELRERGIGTVGCYVVEGVRNA